jgi:3-oxoacyl-[acyl-carrier-protein] synthase II
VVVTGIGAVTPLGLTLEESWKNAVAGVSGIGPITRFDSTKYDVRFAGEVKNFSSESIVSKKDQKKMDLFIQYSLIATKQALNMSGLVINEENSHRVGTIIGVGIGGLPIIEDQATSLALKGPGRISPFFIPSVITNLAPGQVSIYFNIKGPNYTVTSACASGSHALGDAAEFIRNGQCDFMIAGGAESTVCGLGIGGFAAMRALSTRNEDPQKASRPFDKDRDGFVLSEGAAIFILEDYEHAVHRKANIICELTGYGLSGDANHITNPAPGGEGAIRAMKWALQDAGLNPYDINYINAHGTSTPVGDEMETLAIKSAFADHAKKLWISSTKSVMGHALGAAGAIEAAFCAMAIKDQTAPPTMNLLNPSEGCDLDYIPNEARRGPIKHVLNNSFGFGGTNACLIFSKM